jgi:hypothetical protein
MKFPDLNKLCSPAQLYLFFTLLSLIIMIYENSGTHDNMLCFGNYECHNTPSKSVLIFIKLIYIAFWTFILNLICKNGYKNLAWFLVLLPVFAFILLLIFVNGPWIYNDSSYEGMVSRNRTHLEQTRMSKTFRKNTPKLSKNKPNVGKVPPNKIRKVANTKK